MNVLTKTLIASAICLPLIAACGKTEQKPPAPAAVAPTPAETAAKDAGQAVQAAGEATKDAAVKTGEAIKEGAKEAVDKTKEVSKDAAAAVKEAGKDAAAVVKEAGKDVADAAKAAWDAIVPDGAGSFSGLVAGVPAMKVYFDSGKTAVSADFNDKAKELADYLKANPTAKAVISGYNDTTGDAKVNAELSKNRAQSVAAALKSLGVAESQIVLEKPANTTVAGAKAEARRVEVVVRK